MVILGAVGPLIRGKGDRRTLGMTDARRDEVASRRAQLPRLLERENARRIGTDFGLRRVQIATDRLDHEIGASIAAAGKAPIGRRSAQLLHPLNEVVSF